MVGSCLVRDDKIVAEDYHESFGQAHAERALLDRFEEDITPDDVLYVNLEPCCHQGKTPPCTDIIIGRRVKNVVFGMLDPFPEVMGKGIKLLRDRGVKVLGPVSPDICERFNRGYVSVQTKGRPWVTLKRAQTLSGQIANKDGSPLKITTQSQDKWSHTHLRARHDAILVGVQTVINDDPELTVRYGDQNFQPVRIILDPNNRIPVDARCVGKGAIIVNYQFNLSDLCRSLIQKGITSVLVEGGQKTWESFKKANLVDEEVILVG